jgi:hypothetical protein
MEFILVSLFTVVFGWSLHVAVVQLSPGLLWVTIILFCIYLLSVTVCCDISARLIRPNNLYAICYMGLFFDMRVSTFLIPFLQCPITLFSFQAVCIWYTIQTILTCVTLGTPLSTYSIMVQQYVITEI